MTTITRDIATNHTVDRSDDLIGIKETARDVAHHLDTLAISDLMRKDLLDGLCMLLSRMAARRTTAVARMAKRLDETPDVGDEISGVQRDELQDKIAAAGTEISACEDALEGAALAYEELTGDKWVPASASSKQFHGSIALATEIALGTVKPVTPEQDAYRVIVTGDPSRTDPTLVTSYLDRIAAKHGTHRIWIYTGDAPRGVDSTVTEWARSHRVTIRQYGLQFDRHGKRAGFVRNRTMIAQAQPHAVIVFGGGGVQAELVHEAARSGVKHVLAPVPPAGVTVDADMRAT